MRRKDPSEPILLENKAIWEKNKKGKFFTTLFPTKIPFSCPPEFGGSNEPSPEDLFLAAISTCTITTILHICDSLHTQPNSLNVTTSCSLIYLPEKDYEFSNIVCKISITGDRFLLERVCELVPKYCLIGRSIIPKINYEFEILT